MQVPSSVKSNRNQYQNFASSTAHVHVSCSRKSFFFFSFVYWFTQAYIWLLPASITRKLFPNIKQSALFKFRKGPSNLVLQSPKKIQKRIYFHLELILLGGNFANSITVLAITAILGGSAPSEREREMFYLTTHSTHFIYGYMASYIWLRAILIVRKETRCRT